MTLDENIHFHFMGIMGEMVVIYYDHHFLRDMQHKSGTKRAFEAFCGSITKFMGNQSKLGDTSSDDEEGTVIAWLMLELEIEFGLNNALAGEIVVSFFNDCYYHDIYTIQRAANNYLFPNGYYDRLNGKL